MTTRADSSAATRQALLEAAGALLDSGGPQAVTLRDVGARAGVSRGAPYRHFDSKESLLTQIATQAWDDVSDALGELAGDPGIAPEQRLRRALAALLGTARSRPYLYRLMFTTPDTDPAAVVRAAQRAHDLFLTIVAEVVGTDQASQYAALLMTSAHGAADLQISGHLTWDKWHATAEDLVELLIGLLPRVS